MTALCVAPRCHVPGWHAEDCANTQTCRGCLPAWADAGALCHHHADALADALNEIPRLWALLDLQPGRGEPTPLGRINAESAPPVRVDVLNELGPGSVYVHDPGRMQIGELPAWLTLDTLVRDWASHTGEDSDLPAQNVPDLAAWLRARLDWALHNHPAMREIYDEISDLRSRLRPLVNGVDLADWSGRLPGRCPACNRLTLVAERGQAVCHHPTCQRVWVDETAGMR